jgi:alkyl hydroperoxide reductase subunit AhpC
LVSTARPDDTLRIAREHGVPTQRIGRTVAAAFVIERRGVPLICTNAVDLGRIWRTAFSLLLGGDSAEG